MIRRMYVVRKSFGTMSFPTTSVLLLLLLPSCLSVATPSKAQKSHPLACSDSNRGCSAYLYYLLGYNVSKADVASIFDVELEDLTPDPYNKGLKSQGLYIRVNCLCSSFIYLANASYNATTDTTMASIISIEYAGLAWAHNTSMLIAAGTSAAITLLCGCLDNTRDFGFLLSYMVQPNDTLSQLSSRFNSSLESIVATNNISNENIIYAGQVYYLPINIGALVISPPSANPPEAFPPATSPSAVSLSSSNGLPLRLVLYIVGGTIVLVLVAIVVILCARNVAVNRHAAALNRVKGMSKRGTKKKRLLLGGNNAGLLVACCKVGSISKRPRRQMTLSQEMMNGPPVDAEKPVLYTYEEVLAATDHFKESNMLGQGAFGTVFYGMLRDQDVAIKRMKATITKEFLAEMKVLCKFHHTNLNELFGYASHEDDLFLVYEYAEHRAVADRLHDPISKGFTPLTWNARVQIALDTARGLEYIHEHTKEHYVHRDVKTSNILLDADFRAKVADFGLAKLVEKTSGGETSVTRIVGTFGYLAPEYSRDGIATSKSDVYAFGVVLFELITGKEAISRSKAVMPSTPERRSLISIMSRALRDSPNPLQMGKLRELTDPNLLDMYPQDCLYKMAKLGQQCVEEDPILRPDMKYVVFTLSQILLSSVEWEATLGGSSQVFSGLVQGR